MKNNPRVTIQQVAEMAGVSIATVSRVLNRKERVKEETRQRVLESMERLDFNPAASMLSNEDSNTILLCVPDFSNPFTSAVIDGIQKAAQFNNYHVLLMQSTEQYLKFEDYESILKSHPFAGALLLTSVTDAALLNDLVLRCPVVMCSEYFEGNGISFVSIDDIAAARKATEYLIACGRRKIALLNSRLEHKYARHREQGYRQTLSKAGLPINESWISHLSSINYSVALSHAMDILRLPNPPDAFFAVSDVFAVAAISAAKKLGFRVPDDVSVIGFDNIELSSMVDPPITTIAQPSYQLGYQSCILLLDKIRNSSAATKHIILDTELIVRESTAISQYNQ